MISLHIIMNIAVGHRCWSLTVKIINHLSLVAPSHCHKLLWRVAFPFHCWSLSLWVSVISYGRLSLLLLLSLVSVGFCNSSCCPLLLPLVAAGRSHCRCVNDWNESDSNLDLGVNPQNILKWIRLKPHSRHKPAEHIEMNQTQTLFSA